MSVGKRKSAPRVFPRASGQVRVVESLPLASPAAQVDGAGQCLFHLFRDELLALRQRQRATASPARESNHV